MDALNHIHLTVPPQQVKHVLRALLYAIFFHRLMDNVEPETWDILETHVACAPTQAIEKEVSSKIDEFSREYLDTGAERGEIAVVFLQKKPRKGWFAVTEELLPWEEHLITLSFPRAPSKPPSINPLQTALLQILTFCAEKSGNVPPLGSSSPNHELPGTLLTCRQILISPPPPNELFAPSPPLPARSPPPIPTTTTTPLTAVARPRDLALPPSSGAHTSSAAAALGLDGRDARRSSSPASVGAALGYLEQAKDGLRAVGAKAGAVAGWGGRGGYPRA
ncbi:hypothetical protein JCM24511_06302 [Saitozyma sp. JCM 24511]|nr:hypothetical protein JCM24511_06302 [Saitozyma sp. JCM 24511]